MSPMLLPCLQSKMAVHVGYGAFTFIPYQMVSSTCLDYLSFAHSRVMTRMEDNDHLMQAEG